MPLTWVDGLLIAIMGLSGFLAMVRGFTREILSISSWVIAAFAAIYIAPRYKDFAESLIPSPEYAGVILLSVGIFLFVLIVVSLLTVKISDRFLESSVGVLDRTLGFAFGLGRGLILVAILYIILAWLVKKDNMPNGVEEARTLPLIRNTGEIIVSLLPLNPLQEAREAIEGKPVDEKN